MSIREEIWKMTNDINLRTKVKEDSRARTPYIGQKCRIKRWPDYMPPNEAVKLSKLPHLTVEDYLPITVGSDGDYHKEYQLYFKETGTMILPEDCELIWD